MYPGNNCVGGDHRMFAGREREFSGVIGQPERPGLTAGERGKVAFDHLEFIEIRWHCESLIRGCLLHLVLRAGVRAPACPR